jgi:hypothetical protein
MADTVWQDQVSGWTNLAAVRGYRSRPRETKLKVALSALVLALKLALSALVLTFHLMVMKRTETVKTAEVVDATRPCCLQQVREWPGSCWPYNWRPLPDRRRS